MLVVDITVAVANLILACVAIVSLWYNRTQIQEARKQYLETQTALHQHEQVAEERYRETQHDLQRPLLIPASLVVLDGTHPDWSLPTQQITIRNVGVGLATNIRGYILGPQSSSPINCVYTFESEFPLPKNERLEIATGPQKPISGEIAKEIQEYALTDPQRWARLILTYQDIFAKKYISILDMASLYGKDVWVHVAFPKNNP